MCPVGKWLSAAASCLFKLTKLQYTISYHIHLVHRSAYAVWDHIWDLILGVVREVGDLGGYAAWDLIWYKSMQYEIVSTTVQVQTLVSFDFWDFLEEVCQKLKFCDLIAPSLLLSYIFIIFWIHLFFFGIMQVFNCHHLHMPSPP